MNTNEPLPKSVKFYNAASNTLEAGDSSTSSTPSALPSQLPLSKVLTPQVRISIITYTLLAFLDIALRAIQPLFLTASPSFGGLGFSVPLVGTCLAAFFFTSGIYQALAFAPIYAWMGPKRIYVISMMMFVPIWVLFPMMSRSLGKDKAVNVVTWVDLVLQISLYVIMDMGFSEFVSFRFSASEPHSQYMFSRFSIHLHPRISTQCIFYRGNKWSCSNWRLYRSSHWTCICNVIICTFRPNFAKHPDSDRSGASMAWIKSCICGIHSDQRWRGDGCEEITGKA